MVTNPNIGIRPVRRRGASHTPAPGFRLPGNATVRGQRVRRHRRARLGLPAAAELRLPRRLRLGAFARAYAAVGLIVTGLVLYLFQAAGATTASYQIGRLQAQQQDLLSEQDHLRYEQATAQSPDQVRTAAGATGMVRPVPHRYLSATPVDLGLGSPPPQPPDHSPLWERQVAAVGHQLGGEQALAADIRSKP